MPLHSFPLCSFRYYYVGDLTAPLEGTLRYSYGKQFCKFQYPINTLSSCEFKYDTSEVVDKASTRTLYVENKEIDKHKDILLYKSTNLINKNHNKTLYKATDEVKKKDKQTLYKENQEINIINPSILSKDTVHIEISKDMILNKEQHNANVISSKNVQTSESECVKNSSLNLISNKK